MDVPAPQPSTSRNSRRPRGSLDAALRGVAHTFPDDRQDLLLHGFHEGDAHLARRTGSEQRGELRFDEQPRLHAVPRCASRAADSIGIRYSENTS